MTKLPDHREVPSATAGEQTTREIAAVVKDAILEIVDQKMPGSTEVWITGSRAKGNNRPDSDWDVVVLHSKAKPILPGHSGPVILEKKRIFNGDLVEAVRVAPSDWNHPGQYMSDCRQFGFRIR
jgi:predicted nucleotidyltransferase